MSSRCDGHLRVCTDFRFRVVPDLVAAQKYAMLADMSKILVAGSLAYDRIMDYSGNFTEHIVPDKLHTLSVSFNIEKLTEEFGGCAGNVAYNLALLGEDPEMIATVGTDFARYEERLKSLNINTATIHHDPKELTSVAHIVTDSANNQITAFAMAAGAIPYGAFPDLKRYRCVLALAGCMADAQWLAENTASGAREYYCDPGQALPAYSGALLRSIIEKAAGIFANDYELSLIVEKTGWSEAEILGKMPMLVVTFGAKGSEIRTRDEAIKIHAAPISKLVDPTGAGDAHRAGFLKGIVAGLPLKACGQLGSVVAAYAVEKVGTQNHSFTIAELKQRYAAAYNEELLI